MGFFLLSIATFLVLIIQGSVLPLLSDRLNQPDILLVIVICLAIIWRGKRGVIAALLIGLMQDIFFGPSIGFFTLAKGLTAYGVGLVAEELYKDQLAGPIMLVMGASFFHHLVIIGLTHLYFYPVQPLSLYFSNIMTKFFWHFLFTLLIYPIIYQADSKNLFFSEKSTFA